MASGGLELGLARCCCNLEQMALLVRFPEPTEVHGDQPLVAWATGTLPWEYVHLPSPGSQVGRECWSWAAKPDRIMVPGAWGQQTEERIVHGHTRPKWWIQLGKPALWPFRVRRYFRVSMEHPVGF